MPPGSGYLGGMDLHRWLRHRCESTDFVRTYNQRHGTTLRVGHFERYLSYGLGRHLTTEARRFVEYVWDEWDAKTDVNTRSLKELQLLFHPPLVSKLFLNPTKKTAGLHAQKGSELSVTLDWHTYTTRTRFVKSHVLRPASLELLGRQVSRAQWECVPVVLEALGQREDILGPQLIELDYLNRCICLLYEAIELLPEWARQLEVFEDTQRGTYQFLCHDGVEPLPIPTRESPEWAVETLRFMRGRPLMVFGKRKPPAVLSQWERLLLD